MTTALGAVIRPVNNFTLFVMKLVALLALLVAVLAFYLPDTGASTTLSDRFAFDDYSAASRIEQYEQAIEQIERSPITGSGYFEANGHIIHNLFLAAWVHAGIAAFALVLMFYIVLILRWVGIVASVAKRPRRWILPVSFEWIAPLPILPLFRVWLSGDSGSLFFGEWIALAAFFGCVLANELMRRRLIGHARAIAAQEQEAHAVPATATARTAPAFAGVQSGVHFRSGNGGRTPRGRKR
jgi:O-antigen ligase